MKRISPFILYLCYMMSLTSCDCVYDYNYFVVSYLETEVQVAVQYTSEWGDTNIVDTFDVAPGDIYPVAFTNDLWVGGGCGPTNCEHCHHFMRSLVVIRDSVEYDINVCDCEKTILKPIERNTGSMYRHLRESDLVLATLN